MLQRVYAVYDVVSKVAVPPLLMFPNDQAARRMFADLVHGETIVSAHPADYVLLHLGTLDDGTGKFEPVERPLDDGQVISGDAVLERAAREHDDLRLEA